MEVLLCDIDGTLADIRHRLKHVLPGSKRDWGAFFALMDEDGLVEPVQKVVAAAAKSFPVVLCSGRPEEYRALTEAWLARHNVPFERLYMRPEGDLRQDSIVKGEMLATIRGDGFEPFAVIDDRPSVVAMWRDRGLLCLQVSPGDPEIPASAVLTLMVGPSGGGKSHWLQSEAATAMGISPSHIISSDQIRADLCGDFRDQSRNAEVFAAVHSIAKARLLNGLPVVIDATHLRRKDRMTAAQLVPAMNLVRYIVVDRPMDEKRRDGGWRLGLEIDLLARHDQTFRSQRAEILAGDHLPNVTVLDLRSPAPALKEENPAHGKD